MGHVPVGVKQQGREGAAATAEDDKDRYPECLQDHHPPLLHGNLPTRAHHPTFPLVLGIGPPEDRGRRNDAVRRATATVESSVDLHDIVSALCFEELDMDGLRLVLVHTDLALLPV